MSSKLRSLGDREKGLAVKINSSRQGLRTFDGMGDYLDRWVRPNLLEDLDTVFEGAKRRWEEKGRPADGRGDFLLATLLFGTFDHLGAFLAADECRSLATRENIARLACRLPSTADVYAIIAQLGRNALVHGAWPQTALRMDRGGSWAFGLSITANPDPTDHDYLYTRRYSLSAAGASDSTPSTVLKLLLNVHALHRELRELVLEQSTFAAVIPAVFESIQRSAMDPHRAAVSHEGTPEFFSGAGRSPLKDQVRMLRREAEHLGVWERHDLKCYRLPKELRG